MKTLLFTTGAIGGFLDSASSCRGQDRLDHSAISPRTHFSWLKVDLRIRFGRTESNRRLPTIIAKGLTEQPSGGGNSAISRSVVTWAACHRHVFGGCASTTRNIAAGRLLGQPLADYCLANRLFDSVRPKRIRSIYLEPGKSVVRGEIGGMVVIGLDLAMRMPNPKTAIASVVKEGLHSILQPVCCKRPPMFSSRHWPPAPTYNSSMNTWR